jgi:heat shock protein beta
MVSKSLFKIFAILSVISIVLSQVLPGEELNHPEKLNSEDFSEDDRKFIESSSEKHGFNVEVSRLMDIIVNSLYTHKEIFIRELISNSSDACDKVRFIAIQNPEFLGEQKECEIRVEYSKKDKTFSITDSGIGMSKADLVKNLGTIAKSGTTSFIEAISKGQSLNLIGQFGVGFYSTYLVSNKVVVASKTHDDEQHVWISQAGNTFEVIKDPRGNSLGRGTRVTLYLKDDCLEFNNQDVIRKNIKKYSEFINFPIFLRINQTYTREEELELEGTNQTNSNTNTNSTDDFEIKDDKVEEKAAPAKRTVDDWRWEWVRINENQPLWLKNRDDITIEDYNKFYKALTRDSENNPIAYEHSYTEGEVNFKYILYLPDNKPSDMFENYYGRNSALKLYVRRVLVNEQFEELIPRYLNFVKGVVDSDDLPLNVSREQLQQHKMIKVMAKKLVRTVINMLIKLAANTEDEDEDDEDEENKDKEETKTPVDNKYTKFWTAFGKNIKLGVIEDTANRTKLAKLLR